ncbi:hypothetical protein hairong_130 [Pseudomonas phage hairong]|nr:hypothetical protein hairong_130 [Pseudomonas phage hairong]
MAQEPLNYRIALDWMTKLIDKMKQSGWQENEDGAIFFEKEPETLFDNWLEAIQVCIDIGSDL